MNALASAGYAEPVLSTRTAHPGGPCSLPARRAQSAGGLLQLVGAEAPGPVGLQRELQLAIGSHTGKPEEGSACHGDTPVIRGGPVASVVVETDGSLQSLDTLRVSYNGFTHTGLNVFEDTIDDLRGTPVFVACLAADAALPDVCRACELLDVCGGGYLPHRFGRGRKFHNESVHCLDLKTVLRHVQAVIRQDLRPLAAAGALPTLV